MLSDLEKAITLFRKYGIEIIGLRCSPETMSKLEGETISISSELITTELRSIVLESLCSRPRTIGGIPIELV